MGEDECLAIRSEACGTNSYELPATTLAVGVPLMVGPCSRPAGLARQVEGRQFADGIAVADADRNAPVDGLRRARRRALQPARARTEGRPFGPVLDLEGQRVTVGIGGRRFEHVGLVYPCGRDRSTDDLRRVVDRARELRR